MTKVFSIYSSHDASVCVTDGSVYRVFEIERLTGIRFDNLDRKKDFRAIYDKLKEIIYQECGWNSFDVCYFNSLPDDQLEYINKIWKIKSNVFVGHHISHAACSFYQSSFDKALVVSYDGGGYEGEADPDNRVTYFNVYLADRKNGLEKIYTSPLNLGTSYGMLAVPISEIYKTKDDWGKRFLGFAGKIMGLSAYGTVRQEWIDPLIKFYHLNKNHDLDRDFNKLSKDLNMKLEINTLSGQDSFDLAATNQYVFNTLAWKVINEYLNKYDLPLCLTGGCALNILFNQTLKDSLQRDIFIPPNPSDCGLAFGMAAYHIKPLQAVDLTYSGFPILDLDKTPLGKKVTIQDLAKLLKEGKIIGVVRGNSEHGPRALGNRSILCHPGLYNMKDTLNAKVKFREWFRPFAPMVREEDVGKYFKFSGSSKFMSYSPEVRKEWKNKLTAVVHEDGTSRIQTVSYKDNEFIYQLLGEFEKISGMGVLLNTSFNIKGRPILTTVKDAFEVLETTELDLVLIENSLYERKTDNT